MPLLTCEVTLLTHFERAAALDDWEIGVHGVHIDYVDPRGDARHRRLPAAGDAGAGLGQAADDRLARPQERWQQPITDALRRDRPHALPGDEGVARLRRLGAGARADVAGESSGECRAILALCYATFARAAISLSASVRSKLTEVAGDVARVVRRRDGDDALLRHPAQRHRRRRVVRGGDEFTVGSERTCEVPSIAQPPSGCRPSM